MILPVKYSVPDLMLQFAVKTQFCTKLPPANMHKVYMTHKLELGPIDRLSYYGYTDIAKLRKNLKSKAPLLSRVSDL